MSTLEEEIDSSSGVRHITMAIDSVLPETYHLEGGSNFGVWAYRMKNLLQKDGRFHYCLTPPSAIMGEEERTARQQVLSIINSNAKNSALKLLRRYHDPHECWTGLKTRYESDSGPRRVMLIDKFFSLRKTESITMDAHLTEVKEVANLLEEVDVNIPEDIIVYYTLKNLPKEYEIFKRMQIGVQSLPTYEQLEAKLISEETSIQLELQQKEEGEALFSHSDRFKRSHPVSRHNPTMTQNPRYIYPNRRLPDSGGFSSNRASNTEIGGSSTPKFYHQQKFPGSAPRTPIQGNYQPRYRPRGPDKPRSDKCNYCGLEGHFERECELRSILDRMKDFEHRLSQQRNRNLNGQVHHLEDPVDPLNLDQDSPNCDSAEDVVDACLVELNLLETPSQTPLWYLDSGATHHVSGDSSIFSSIQPTSGSQVRSAGGQSHNVVGVGNADIQLPSGAIKSISSVLYTPGITKNLLSVGTLADQHKTLVFRSHGCFVIDNSTLQVENFAPRETNKGLYSLSGARTCTHPEVHLLYPTSHATLWHKRLGHFHTKGIQRMIQFQAVKGLPNLHFSQQTCSGCQLGKHSRTKIPKVTTHRASSILELIHSDVCGPFRINSLGGARYFVTFIDDFSRKTWIYFITHKSQVLEKFKIFVQLVETTTGKLVKTLRTDNGGEYTSKDFYAFCSSKGITREMPPPYTPERNGVAERRNRSLLDITRCLLIDNALPGHLWGEAVKAAGDILNLRSTKQHPARTPQELFYGTKPSVSHLRIFGSPVFVHIPKNSRSKLDPRSEKCVLLSFDEAAHAYRCYRPSTKRVFVSRDVFIDETPLLPSPIQLPSTPTPLLDTTHAPTKTEELKSLAEHSTHPPQATPNDDTILPQVEAPVPAISHSIQPISPTSVEPTSESLSPPCLPSSSSPPPIPVPPRRSERVRRFPRHLQEFAAHLQIQDHAPDDLTDNITFKQAQHNSNWRMAMQDEINSIYKNNTWSLVPLPPGTKAITSRWVYKLKPALNDNALKPVQIQSPPCCPWFPTDRGRRLSRHFRTSGTLGDHSDPPCSSSSSQLVYTSTRCSHRVPQRHS